MINTLLLVGCGHMGHAMLAPWLKARAAKNILVVSPRAESLHGLQGVTHVAFSEALPESLQPDVVVFAVKPQIAGDVLPAYKKFSSALFLSVIAGKKLDFYQDVLGREARVIRAMPNLPAKIGQGATLLVAGAQAQDEDKQTAAALLTPLGLAAWLEHEGQMDAATALSGCGPAYFYLLADVLANAGASLGLPPALAAQLARQTMIGSAGLWAESPESAETLYHNIAVKGGMTEAALAQLQENGALEKLLQRALEAAATRGKALSGT